MQKQPLAEVFGFPPDNLSREVERYRKNRLCPFHNRVPSCTKNSATDPLGVCCIFHEGVTVITCPIRFTEEWIITEDAAKFYFSKDIVNDGRWTSLREVPLKDKFGKAAGNIDYVLVSYDHEGRIMDFGSLEIQAVYISGNISDPFKYYMRDRAKRKNMDWSSRPKYPRPDYLSSSRKRLVPQMIYKGGILMTWGKKQAVVIQKSFYDTLPPLPSVGSPDEADIAWFVYDLRRDNDNNRLKMELYDTVYTQFRSAVDQISTADPGNVDDFIQVLQDKLNEERNSIPPDAPTLTDITTLTE